MCGTWCLDHSKFNLAFFIPVLRLSYEYKLLATANISILSICSLVVALATAVVKISGSSVSESNLEM